MLISQGITRGGQPASTQSRVVQNNVMQWFGATWTLFRSFSIMFCTNFAVFKVLGAEAGRAPEPAQSENLGDFEEDSFDLERILLILGGISKISEDLRDFRREIQDFRKDLSLPASLEPIDFFGFS